MAHPTVPLGASDSKTRWLGSYIQLVQAVREGHVLRRLVSGLPMLHFPGKTSLKRHHSPKLCRGTSTKKDGTYKKIEHATDGQLGFNWDPAGENDDDLKMLPLPAGKGLGDLSLGDGGLCEATGFGNGSSNPTSMGCGNPTSLGFGSPTSLGFGNPTSFGFGNGSSTPTSMGFGNGSALLLLQQWASAMVDLLRCLMKQRKSLQNGYKGWENLWQWLSEFLVPVRLLKGSLLHIYIYTHVFYI